MLNKLLQQAMVCSGSAAKTSFICVCVRVRVRVRVHVRVCVCVCVLLTQRRKNAAHHDSSSTVLNELLKFLDFDSFKALNNKPQSLFIRECQYSSSERQGRPGGAWVYCSEVNKGSLFSRTAYLS